MFLVANPALLQEDLTGVYSEKLTFSVRDCVACHLPTFLERRHKSVLLNGTSSPLCMCTTKVSECFSPSLLPFCLSTSWPKSDTNRLELRQCDLYLHNS